MSQNDLHDKRTPLARARGLGSAQSGTHHWWLQRVTSLALIPLVTWLAFVLVGLAGANHNTVSEFIAKPYNMVLFILLTLVGMHHALSGLQVVYEDYIQHKGARLAVDLVTKAFGWVLAAVTILAILMIGLKG